MPESTTPVAPLVITLDAPIEITTTVITTSTASDITVDALHVRPSDAAPWLSIRLSNGREIRVEGEAYSNISAQLRADLVVLLKPHIDAALAPAPAPEPEPEPAPSPAPDPAP